MIDEESYSALYLYNALIEYIFFLMILIQDRGPNPLDNVAKHVKFFKKEVHTFIQTFNGSDLAYKVGQMLYFTTPVFEVKENVLHLAKNSSYFKRVIYEDFLVSKVVDLILRGICNIKDICQYLNLNSIISIKEDNLMEIIQYYPYFHFDSNKSVILLQYHGLIGFEKHIYDTTVNYFLSCFQNVAKFTYSDVKLHSSCIPSCAIKNSIIVFCLLHVSPLFKFRCGKVYLRNRLKRKRHSEQVVGIERLQSTIPVGYLVNKNLGSVISGWTGEISRLFSSGGLIQAVVSSRNDEHGVFLVYFNYTTLKHASEIKDLRQFLNIRDVVEFDAEFCSKAWRVEMFWEATRLKVINSAIKQSKYELKPDVGEYMENVLASRFNIRPLSKVCSASNCAVESLALQEILAPIRKKSCSHIKIENEKEIVSEKFVTQVSESNEEITMGIQSKCENITTPNCNANTSLSATHLAKDLVKSDIQKISNNSIQRNGLEDTVNVPNENLNSIKTSTTNCSSTLPKEISDSNKNLNAVSSIEDNNCPMQVPKIYFEEKEFTTQPNEISSKHESNNKSYSLVVCSNLPKKISNPNKNLERFCQKEERSVQMAKMTKKCFKETELPSPPAQTNSRLKTEHKKLLPDQTKNLDTEIASQMEKSKLSIQVPNMTEKCIKENDLPVHPNTTSSLPEIINNFYPNITNISNNSTFLFGVVTFISAHDGIADCRYKDEQCTVFFKKHDIYSTNCVGKVIKKGKTVLLYVPYVGFEDHVLIATLVYPLTPQETIETEKNGFRAEDFIVNHFSQLVKSSHSDSNVSNCDASKSLLLKTELQSNFREDQSSDLKALHRINEVCKMSAKTYDHLCSFANKTSVKNIISGFSIAKHTPSKLHSNLRYKSTIRSNKVNAKKAPFETQSQNFCDNAHLVDLKEKKTTTFLKPGDVVEKCSIDDNCNIVDLKDLTNNPLIDQIVKKKDYLKVSHDSCSSVSSVSSCFDDFEKDSSDDVFYSCESDFDSGPGSHKESPQKNKPLSEKELLTMPVNVINNTSPLHNSANEGCETKTVLLKQKTLMEKKFYHFRDTYSYLKLRNSSSFKHTKKKCKSILPVNNNCYKSFHKPVLVAMAEISIIRKSCIYFKLINEPNNATLAFPKYLVPSEMQKNIRLNKIVKVTFAPHPLLNLSQALYIDF